MTDLLTVTFLAMVLDVALGFAGAVKTGTVKSGKMREGLWHKAGFVGLVAVAFLLEYFIAHVDASSITVPYIVEACNALAAIPLVLAACVWVILTEAVSVVENLCVLNPEIEKSPIGRIFAALEDDDKTEVEEGGGR